MHLMLSSTRMMSIPWMKKERNVHVHTHTHTKKQEVEFIIHLGSKSWSSISITWALHCLALQMWIAWKCQAIVGAQSLQETEVSCETIQLQGIPGNGSKSVTSANNTYNTLLWKLVFTAQILMLTYDQTTYQIYIPQTRCPLVLSHGLLLAELLVPSTRE
jgi:hypothetical protein